VVHVADIGMSRCDDGEILRRALAEARLFVTKVAGMLGGT